MTAKTGPDVNILRDALVLDVIPVLDVVACDIEIVHHSYEGPADSDSRCGRRSAGWVTKSAVGPDFDLLSSMGACGPAIAKATTDPQGMRISGN